MPKYGVFSGPYFPEFSPNTGKYGPGKTPHFDTFHAVDNSSVESNKKKIITSTKLIYREEMILLCKVSENEINLKSNGLRHKEEGRTRWWLEHHR